MYEMMLFGENKEEVSKILAITAAMILAGLGIFTNSAATTTVLSTEAIGNQTDSKYLTITGHRYREGGILRSDNWSYC
jgi:hypothetical protein